MANGRIIPFAGVAQSPERRCSLPEVAGKIPAPRSILPFPRPYARFRPEPFIVVVAALSAALALVLIALTAYASVIVSRGLP